jgi:benzil reductase ((S)-benzoin forming)
METLLILTGHTKGLGRAILDQFLNQSGNQIIAVSRTLSGLDAATLTELALDLSDLDALTAALPQLLPSASFDRYILINNAGAIGSVKPVGKLDPRGIQKVINLNFTAPAILIDAFARTYAGRSGEKIVCNISSGAARKPLPGWAEYCSTKAGLEMFAKVAGEELAESGVRVFSVAPGIVDTGMQEEIRKADPGDFPALDRFVSYKSEGLLSSPEAAAEKIYRLVTQSGEFQGVEQDVRKF